MWFVSPRPTAEWLKRRYEHYGEHLFQDPSKLASDFAPGRFDHELRLLRGLSGHLLDVGCATGSFVAAARISGFDAEGIDLSEQSTRYGREQLGLPLRAGDLTALQLTGEGYDVITMWATVEHLPDPGWFLREARRLLRPGGVVGFSVPNHGAFSQRLLGFRNRYVGIDHLNYFDVRTVRRFCTRHDFSVMRTETMKINPIVIWQDLRGRTPGGASIGRQLEDQARTDNVKYSSKPTMRALRSAHNAVNVATSALGLGDLLLVVAQRN